jgi:hypothetical protein
MPRKGGPTEAQLRAYLSNRERPITVVSMANAEVELRQLEVDRLEKLLDDPVHQKPRPNEGKHVPVFRTCAADDCDQRFEVGEGISQRKYCSDECRRTSTMRSFRCEGCGKQFTSSARAGAQFCSQPCRSRAAYAREKAEKAMATA